MDISQVANSSIIHDLSILANWHAFGTALRANR
jgi:hypothetical protein